MVREILANHEGMPPESPPRVYFDEFNPDSLSIRFFYWYSPPDYWAFSTSANASISVIIRRFAEPASRWRRRPRDDSLQMSQGSRWLCRCRGKLRPKS